MKSVAVMVLTLLIASVSVSDAEEKRIIAKAPLLNPVDFSSAAAKTGRFIKIDYSALNSSSTVIDTAVNGYSMLFTSVNPLFYQPDTGLLAWVGRALGENLSGSGVLGFNYSTDGGATWPNRQIDLNMPSALTGARYPSALAIADYPIIIYLESYTGLHPILMWDYGWGIGWWTYNDFFDPAYVNLWGPSPVLADNGNIFTSFISFTGGESYYLSYSGNTSDLHTLEVNLDASIFPDEIPGSAGASVLNKSAYSYTGGGYMTVGGAWDMDSASSAPRAEDRNLAYKLSPDDGETWGDVVMIGEGSISGFPDQTDSTDAFFQTYATNHTVDSYGNVHFTGNVVSNEDRLVLVSHVGKENDEWSLHVIDSLEFELTEGALCGVGCEMMEPVVTPSGVLVLVYMKGTALEDTVPGGMIASDIFISESEDGGETWSVPHNLTGSWGIDEMFAHASPTVEVIGDTERVHIVYHVDVEEPVGNLLGKHVYYHIKYDRFVTGLPGGDGVVPVGFSLDRNYPNPFNPTTTIRYALPKRGRVMLTIYNLLGEEIARLVDETQKAGYHSVTWKASTVASGIYFYRLESSDFTQVKKMVLLK